jgi:hypothetical protein
MDRSNVSHTLGDQVQAFHELRLGDILARADMRAEAGVDRRVGVGIEETGQLSQRIQCRLTRKPKQW